MGIGRYSTWQSCKGGFQVPWQPDPGVGLKRERQDWKSEREDRTSPSWLPPLQRLTAARWKFSWPEEGGGREGCRRETEPRSSAIGSRPQMESGHRVVPRDSLIVISPGKGGESLHWLEMWLSMLNLSLARALEFTYVCSLGWFGNVKGSWALVVSVCKWEISTSLVLFSLPMD